MINKNDYVGVYWIKTDIEIDYDYEYFSYVPFNEAVWETKFLCEQRVINENRQLVYDEFTKECHNEWVPSEFADAYERVMDEFVGFEVWRVLPETPREAIEDLFDSSPDLFLQIWCVREV